ncbi:hypothetical protein ACS0TY_036233 [Phlomoides rotata]
MILDSTSKEHYDPTQVLNAFREVEEALRSANLRLLRVLRLDSIDTFDSNEHPPSDDFVLGNLQSVSIVRLSECREKVVKGIPNIKKLKITCEELDRKSLYCFNNLCHIDKLEHLSCDFQMFPSCPVLQQSNLLRSILIFVLG